MATIVASIVAILWGDWRHVDDGMVHSELSPGSAGFCRGSCSQRDMAGVAIDDAVRTIYLDLAAQWRDLARQPRSSSSMKVGGHPTKLDYFGAHAVGSAWRRPRPTLALRWP